MKKIGYTTGVFDMFHIGHLNLLKRAKLNCDYLVVGITTDEFCSEYKGKTPIIPFHERKEIIKSLKYVDEVVPQENHNKFKAWEKIRFNLLFIGDDWKNTEKWKNHEIEFAKVGVEIVYFSYTANTSSTYLRNVLKKIYRESND